MGLDVSIDGVFEIGDGFEDAPPDFSAGDGREESLRRIEPRCRRWREVEGPSRVLGQPFHDIGVLVRFVVVENCVNDFPGRHGALHGVEEADELLMPMLAHAAPDHGSVENVQRSEQRRRSIAFVVVGHGPAFSRLERQTRLRAIKRLDLAFLVDRYDDSVRRRVHLEADDMLDLLGEFGIAGALVGADAMRLQTMRFPQSPGRRAAICPWPLAMARPVQWVASPGGSEQVNSSTFATTLVESGALPGLRVLSRRRPSTPCSP